MCFKAGYAAFMERIHHGPKPLDLQLGKGALLRCCPVGHAQMGVDAGDFQMGKAPNGADFFDCIAAFPQTPHTGVDAHMYRKCLSIVV